MKPEPSERIARLGPITDLRRFADCPDCWLGTLAIAGTDFHVECIEVDPTAETTTAVNPDYQDRIEAVGGFDDGSRYQTVMIQDRPHFIVIIPFQA